MPAVWLSYNKIQCVTPPWDGVTDDDENTDDDDVEAETENYDLNAEYLEDFRLV